jgi:hypothetical protein
MAKPLKDAKELRMTRPARAEVSAQEALKKMKEFSARKEQFVASVRKGTN